MMKKDVSKEETEIIKKTVLVPPPGRNTLDSGY